MNHNPVGWFDIPVSDMERAKKFYETLFNITLSLQAIPDYEMAWFPMTADAKGTSGALMKGMGYTPGATGTVIYFTCPDIDKTLDHARSLGSRVILPKKDLGQWGYIAWITDSEGNIVALHRRKDE